MRHNEIKLGIGGYLFSIFSKKKDLPKYRYALINYRTSLIGESRDIPLAVVVETWVGSWSVILGHTPDLQDDISEFEKAIIDNLPDCISKQIDEYKDENPSIKTIEALSLANRWNIYLTNPEEIKSDLKLKEVAFMLFARFVAKDYSKQINANPDQPIDMGSYLYMPHHHFGHRLPVTT